MEHKCDYCDGVFEVYDENSGFPFRERGAPVKYVRITVDPYRDEIERDDTLYWLCADCYTESLYQI